MAALLTMVFTSAAAAMMGATVLGKQVYDLSGRELDLGWLGLAEFAPAALLVLATGAAADRWDRRRVVAVAAVGEAAAALGLAWYAGTDPTAVGPILAIVVVFGSFRAFLAPAARALPADLVAPEDLPWLIPRQSAAWQMALVAGPVAGGFLYVVDRRLPYVAMAVLLAVAAAAGLAVRTVASRPADPVGHPLAEAAIEAGAGHGHVAGPGAGWHEALAGLRFIRGHPVLLGAISLDLFAVLFGGAVALLPALADDHLGVGAVGLGWLRAAGGIGASAMTLTLAVRPLRRRVGRVLMAAVAVFGAATVVLGVTRSFAVAFAAMVVLSAADAVSVFIRATLVPLATPRRTRGRVLAVENVFIGASNELGAFESGVAGQLLGAGPAVVLGGVATLAVAGTWWLAFPDLRDLPSFPEPEEATPA